MLVFFVIDHLLDVPMLSLPSEKNMLAFELVFEKKLHRLKHNE